MANLQYLLASENDSKNCKVDSKLLEPTYNGHKETTRNARSG